MLHHRNTVIVLNDHIHHDYFKNDSCLFECVFVTCVTDLIVVPCDHNINQRSDSDSDDDAYWGISTMIIRWNCHWWQSEWLSHRSWCYCDDFYLLGLSSALKMMMMKMISLSRSHSLMNCQVKRCPSDTRASITRWSVAFNAFNHRFIRQAWPLITVALADSGILGHPRYVTPPCVVTSQIMTRACVRVLPPGGRDAAQFPFFVLILYSVKSETIFYVLLAEVQHYFMTMSNSCRLPLYFTLLKK